MHDAINLSCYSYSSAEAEQLVDERGRRACQVAGGRRPEGASAPRLGWGSFLHMPAHAPNLPNRTPGIGSQKASRPRVSPLTLSLAQGLSPSGP